MLIYVDTNSLDELARSQLPEVIRYCEENGIVSISKASPVWMGLDKSGNAVVIPPTAYKPRFPGSKPCPDSQQ